jgi:ribosome-associated translation inhibitor RaiA
VEIRIESPQFPLEASLHRYLRRRLDEDLAFCADRIREVRAYLSDTRNAYGCIDKQCRLVVCLRREGEIAAQSVETDLFMAIRLAADRLQRGLRRRLGRRSEPRRPRVREPGALPLWLGVP